MKEKFKSQVLLIGEEQDRPIEWVQKDKLKDVTFVSIEEANKHVDMFPQRVNPGEVYILHPNENKYLLNDENLEINIFKINLDIFGHFITLLDLTYDFTVDIHEKTFFGLINKTKGKYNVAKGDLNIESKEDRQLHQMLGAGVTGMVKPKLTLEEYQRALDYYNEHPYLKANEKCRELLSMRDPEGGLTQKDKMYVNLSLSCDINQSIKAAANLKSLKMMSVSENLTVKRKLKRKVDIHYIVNLSNSEKELYDTRMKG